MAALEEVRLKQHVLADDTGAAPLQLEQVGPEVVVHIITHIPLHRRVDRERCVLRLFLFDGHAVFTPGARAAIAGAATRVIEGLDSGLTASSGWTCSSPSPRWWSWPAAVLHFASAAFAGGRRQGADGGASVWGVSGGRRGGGSK